MCLVYLNFPKFYSETCNKTFSQTSSLLKHKRIHDGSKPFVCDFAECGRAFSQVTFLGFI